MIDVDARDRGSEDDVSQPASRRRRRAGFGRWWRTLALAGLVIGVGVLMVELPGRRGWFDIAVYYDAMKNWAHAPTHLYDFVRPGTRFGFTYPPFAAVCMLPMAWMSWDATIVANLAVTSIASVFVVYVLLEPVARRERLNRPQFYTVAGCLFLLFGPVRDTFGFGQINLVLVALVYTDLFLLEQKRSRWTGVGTGLAAAIKLTPAIFILYFLIARRWRAAAVSATTMVGATAVAAVAAPGATATYFTKAIWNTNRVGNVSDIFNQSLMGIVARLNPARPNHLLWIALVAVVLGIWAWRVRSTHAAGDDRAGFALTGVAAGLVSPITWIHHLVWLVPALVVLAESALPSVSSGWRRWLRLFGAVGTYAAFCSGVVWIWSEAHHGLYHFLAGYLDVLISVALLLWLPVRRHADIRPITLAEEPEDALPR